jgi:MFS family permease
VSQPPVRERASAFVAPLRHRAYRRLWLSQVASETGDWAARLALAALVYSRTDSAAWSALVFVGGLIPMLGPGQLLATLADSCGRRAVMVWADVARMVLFAVLALPLHLPVSALLALSVVAGLAAAPFEAARSSAVVEVSDSGDVAAAVSLTHATQDLAVLVGYAAGGWLLAVVGTSVSLAVNAGTFAVSAVLLWGLPALRPTAARAPARAAGRTLRQATRTLRQDAVTRRFVLLATVAVASGSALDALLVPLTDAAGQAWLAGPLLAGVAALSLVLTVYLGSERTTRALLDITFWATAAPAALGAAALLTGWLPMQVLGVLLTGGLYVTLVAAGIVVGPRLPEAVRATCFAVLGGVLTAGQVVLSTVGGLLADHLDPGRAGAFLLMAPIAAALWHRLRPVDVPDRAAAATVDEPAQEGLDEPAEKGAEAPAELLDSSAHDCTPQDGGRRVPADRPAQRCLETLASSQTGVSAG